MMTHRVPIALHRLGGACSLHTVLPFQFHTSYLHFLPKYWKHRRCCSKQATTNYNHFPALLLEPAKIRGYLRKYLENICGNTGNPGILRTCRICGSLRKSAEICGNLQKSAEIYKNLRRSAELSGDLRKPEIVEIAWIHRKSAQNMDARELRRLLRGCLFEIAGGAPRQSKN